MFLPAHQLYGFLILTNYLVMKKSGWFISFSSKQFDLLKELGLGNRGKEAFIIVFFSEQAQIQSIFIHFIFQSLVKVSSCTFDIIG